jgi:hypothetical protein
MKEFIDTSKIKWRCAEGLPAGVYEKILSTDAKTGSHSRLVKFDPGVRTEGRLCHDFWEEILILEGNLEDLYNNQLLEKGFYTCRAPGVKHGPYGSSRGCVVFEVRNYYEGDKRVRGEQAQVVP